MPVDFQGYDPETEGELHLAEGTNAYEILNFLASNPERGYTPKEISEQTGVPRGSVGTTLSRLAEHDLVRHKEPYWAVGEDDRLAAYGAMVHGIDGAEERFGDEEWGDWRETAVDPRPAGSEADHDGAVDGDDG